MAEIRHFQFYETFRDNLCELDDATQLKFYRAIIDYGLDGTEPEFTGLEKALWKQFKFAIDNQKSRSDTARSNGKQNGATASKPEQTEANGSKTKQTEANQSKTERMEAKASKPEQAGAKRAELEEEVEEELEKEVEGERECGKAAAPAPHPSAQPPTAHRFTKPTVEEVALFCKENGLDVDARRFIDYYNSNGWKVGRNPMKDWHATARNWSRGAFSKTSGTVWGRENDMAENYMDIM